jgi:hypothetical protein
MCFIRGSATHAKLGAMIDPSLYGYVGIGLAVAIFVVVFVFLRGSGTKLPELPPFGPLPVADLPKYYSALREPAIAWEALRGWRLNAMPPSFDAAAPVDNAILTSRLLNFCTARGRRLTLVFNFLVGAILRVDFDPSALPPGTAPPGSGLVTIQTPSGRTLLVASSGFAEALRGAVARAKG